VSPGRFEANRKRGAKDEAVAGGDWSWIDNNAEAAEDVVAGLFGLVANHNTGKADPGWEFVVNGRRVDTKWRMTWREGQPITLNVEQWKGPLRADVYATVIGRPPHMYAAGWATRDEVLRAQVVDLGRTRKSSGKPAPLSVIPALALHPMFELGAFGDRKCLQASAERCATCGAPAVHRFMDNSPAFTCGPHAPTERAVMPHCELALQAV